MELSERRASKTKLAKIVVECRKEGTVNYLSPENLDQPGSQKWEKCKLVLVKTVSGYMLEFYSPPKSQKVLTSEGEGKFWAECGDFNTNPYTRSVLLFSPGAVCFAFS